MTTTRLTHDALIYDSDGAFVDAVGPFLREGLEAGEGTVVATSAHNASLIRDELGANADSIVFADADEVYRTPATAVAAYDTVIRSLTEAGYTSLRAIGEVQHGTAISRWLPYEPVAHEVFAKSPLWVVCPYDARTLPERLIEHARKTHPTVLDPHRRNSDTFTEPERVLRSLQPTPTLVPDGPPAAQFSVSGNLRSLRRALLEKLPPGRDDSTILTVVNEIATNAVRHGSGTAYVSLWLMEGATVCDIYDPGGRLDDPFAGYRPPVTHAAGGMGLWIARQMSDEFTIMPGRGLTIRIGFLH